MNFLNNYNHPKNIRFGSFKFALTEAYKRNHKTIVETGTSRGKQKFWFFSKINWKDGMSTMIFSDFVKDVGGRIYSCDIDNNNISNAKKFVKNNLDFITFVNDDSLNFLNSLNIEIDFLYLDSLDAQIEGSNEHQLNEIKLALPKLKKNSLILLDDKGAKTELSARYLLDKNYKIINETNEQLLLSL